ARRDRAAVPRGAALVPAVGHRAAGGMGHPAGLPVARGGAVGGGQCAADAARRRPRDVPDRRDGDRDHRGVRVVHRAHPQRAALARADGGVGSVSAEHGLRCLFVSAATGPAVRVQDVVKHYGDTAAVDGLGFEVEQAQVLALLGPNGAGKTTTVEMCEGFVRPDAGSVRVLGLDPIADSERLRPRMGVMLQGGGAYPGSRAGEMLDLVASYSADPLDPDWLLDVLGLRDN